MGVLVEARGVFRDSEQRVNETLGQARINAIDREMEALSEIVSKPAYVGDVETALVHHMGRGAFGDEVTTKPFIELEERIRSAGEEISEHDRVPILFIFSEFDPMDGTPYAEQTVVMTVNPKRVQFHSEKEKYEATAHAHTGQKVDVTRSTLSMGASTMSFKGDLLASDQSLGDATKKDIKFILAEDHEADGDIGNGPPSDWAYNNHGLNRFEGEPKVFVGWSEIEAAVIDSMRSRPDMNLEDAIKFWQIFSNTGLVTGAAEHAPKLAGILRDAESLQVTLGNIAITLVDEK